MPRPLHTTDNNDASISRSDEVWAERLLAKTTDLVSAGDWSAAEQLCLEVLHEYPSHPHASYLLGLARLRAARYDEAFELMRAAVSACPEQAVYQNGLADVSRARGDVPAAMSAYRITLLLAPGQALAHNHLGLLKYQRGDLLGATAAFEAALVSDPTDHDIRINLGIVLQKLDRFRESIAYLREVLDARPDDAQALHNLSLALKASGNLSAATDAARAASTLAPDVAVVFGNLAEILEQASHHTEAEQACRQALRLEPRESRYQDLLQTILRQGTRAATDVDQGHAGGQDPVPEATSEQQHPIGDLAQQAASARESALYSALVDTHDDLETLHALVELYANEGDAQAAIAACTKGLGHYPLDAMFFAHRGIALTAQGHLEAAIDDLRTAARLDDGMSYIHGALGDALQEAGEMRPAREAYQRALALEPGLAPAHNNLGAVLLAMGEIDTARECFERALELDPALALAWKNLSSTHGPATTDGLHIERLRTLIDQPGLAATDLVYLHFALAKLLDDAGHYDEAFDHYSSANRLGGKSAHYEYREHAKTIDRIIEQFNKERIDRGLPGASPSHTPIFIVGMPRSGSTLVEQILSSHPLVGGGGEFGFFDGVRFGRQAGNGPGVHYRAYLEQLEERDVHMLTQSYLERLRKDAPRARHVTDKLLSNYLHLGIIAMAFPRARVIHCQRDAMDTCLSIFFRELPNVAFSWDLFDIGRHYREYVRLMSHWNDVLEERLYPIRYEALVDDVESTARGLVEHCGLAWDERCLQYYNNERTVMTNSVWQVRQPIYTHAVERWKRYAAHLDPLRAGLQSATQPGPSGLATRDEKGTPG